MVKARQGGTELDFAHAAQIVGLERGERMSQLDTLNQVLDVIAALVDLDVIPYEETHRGNDAGGDADQERRS